MANFPTVEELLYYLDKTLSPDRATEIELLLKSDASTSKIVKEMLNGVEILRKEFGDTKSVLDHISESTKQMPAFPEDLPIDEN